MGKFGDKVKKKIGKGYNCEKQGIEDAQYLYLPDASTYDIPKTEYRVPKELSKAGRSGVGWEGTNKNKKK